jgi:hypothetical protein
VAAAEALLAAHRGWGYVAQISVTEHTIRCQCGEVLTLKVYGERETVYRAHVAAALAAADLLADPAATDAAAARARREALDEVERIAAETWPGPIAPDLDVVAQHYLDRLRETCRAVRGIAEPATEDQR